ncbi:ABC transporter permease [Parenemella sanctibonifatiensis]|uniref:Multidrug ABC transporter permease n=1 Tax=Parenemella sanctibonifatiensis TaxID=2016505 RepID=A0A255E9Q6_9ACTN|nr:ABC transporter permease [Parenemella sanctibonifatiensis]OYN88308.1 multidrug ABC transporter permease [Parenemella sanctibonifatiensis]
MSESTLTRPVNADPAVPSASIATVFVTLLRWTLAQTGAMLPLIIVVQALLAAGIIVGFGLLIPDVDTASAAFLSTGAPTVLLLTVGLVIVPQGVAEAKANGTFAYQRALPVPRGLILLADLVIWLLVALPSVAVAVLVAALRFDITFAVNWPVLVAASILTALTATAVGYGIAVVLPPMLAQVISQVLVFFVLLFSPITFPAERLPEWFQGVHDFLPMQPAGDLIRAGLLSDAYAASATDLLILAGWCILGLAVSLRTLARRD